jgi:Fe-S-cluster-containing dehydrogenase component/CRP-like cAMP-binding protein
MEDITYTTGPKRWGNSFNDADGLSEQEIDTVLQTPLLAQVDSTKFSEKLSLRGIIKHDSRIREFENKQVICGKGDYDSAAYIILSGEVGILSEDVKSDVQATADKHRKKTFLQKLTQIWNTNKYPEVRDIGARNTPNDIPCIFIDDPGSKQIVLGVGELVGEIAALARSQRTATLYSVGKTRLLEIRWQGLRDLMMRDNGLKDFVLQRYRERSLSVQLKNMPLLKNLSDHVIDELVEATSFAQYGSFDWYSTYKKQLNESPDQRMHGEQIIVEQGDYIDGLMIVSAGFCRTTENVNITERTIGYLTKNGLIGLNEIKHAAESGDPVSIQHNVRAVGYVDILTIPTALVEKYILPLLNQFPEESTQPCGAANTSLLEFLVDNRVINGTKSMVIDLERCVRCDECVKACQSTHDGNPRFRRTPQAQYDRFMIANACMHCTDPVCMIGCPTGAIQRNKVGGEVVIDPYLCIGCGTCAANCPYENIVMVDIRDKKGNLVINKDSGNPVQQATKCDLCSSQKNGPACERACAHDALKRLDFHSLDDFNAWVAKK